MSHRLGRIRVIGALVAPFFLVISCTSSADINNEAMPSAVVEAYASATPRILESLGVEDQASPVPESTPTPFSYAIVAGDTLLGIAERNGISLDILLLANPDVDARFLSIGQELLIPLGGDSNVALNSELSPAALIEKDTSCFGSAAGELWCFFLVENNLAEAVESPQAQIRLFSDSGELLAEKMAVGLIQKLDRGSRMPLVAYWDATPEGWTRVTSELTSGFLLDDPAARYVDLDLEDLRIKIGNSGLVAEVSGGIAGEGLTSASAVWILALAYDVEGQVVGTRRWEVSEGQEEFVFEVFSLGPQISEVGVLAEARR